MKIDYLQLIPLAALGIYMLYVLYYIAVPMWCVKALLFYAHMKYRGIEIRFRESRIYARLPGEKKERFFERYLDEEDLDSRFYAMALLAALRQLLAEIRKDSMARC